MAAEKRIRTSSLLRIAFVALLSVLVLPGPTLTVVAQKAPVNIPVGTVVIVKIDESVSGKTHMLGSIVRASVGRDVVLDSVLVIKIGTPVDVTVAQSEKAGAVGQAGAVNLNIESTTSVDGQMIFLRGMAGAEGQAATGTAVGAGVVLCPLFLLVKGKEGVIAAGTQFQARSQNAISVQVPE